MANPIKGEVAFTAGENEYKIVYDFNAIVELEDTFDTEASNLDKVIGNRVKNLRTVFRIGLSRYHDISDIEAGEIMSEVGAPKVGELIKDAFSKSFETEPVGNGGKAPAKARSR